MASPPVTFNPEARRNSVFHPSYEPLRSHHKLSRVHTTGPLSFLHPTHAVFEHADLNGRRASAPVRRISADSDTNTLDEEKAAHPHRPRPDEQFARNISFQWRSRDNRKGRHSLLVEPVSRESEANFIVPERTNTVRAVLKGILRMFTVFPYWDISYWIGLLYTIGSVVWVIEAFFVWLPLVAPSTEFSNEILYGGGITTFLGATIFEVASVFLMWEAINENSSGCFGWALEQVAEKEHLIHIKPDSRACRHHHVAYEGDRVRPIDSADPNEVLLGRDGHSWRWFTTWHDVRTNYIRKIGFIASLSQFLGATVFWISGFTALPGIIDHMSQPLIDGVYWVPQIVGGVGFIISGLVSRLLSPLSPYVPNP
jgi:hypothetical protein